MTFEWRAVVGCPWCSMELPLEYIPSSGDFAMCLWCCQFVVWRRGIVPWKMTRAEFSAESDLERQRALQWQRALGRVGAGVDTHLL